MEAGARIPAAIADLLGEESEEREERGESLNDFLKVLAKATRGSKASKLPAEPAAEKVTKLSPARTSAMRSLVNRMSAGTAKARGSTGSSSGSSSGSQQPAAAPAATAAAAAAPFRHKPVAFDGDAHGDAAAAAALLLSPAPPRAKPNPELLPSPAEQRRNERRGGRAVQRQAQETRAQAAERAATAALEKAAVEALRALALPQQPAAAAAVAAGMRQGRQARSLSPRAPVFGEPPAKDGGGESPEEELPSAVASPAAAAPRRHAADAAAAAAAAAPRTPQQQRAAPPAAVHSAPPPRRAAFFPPPALMRPPRVAFLGVFATATGAALAAHCPPGAQGLRYAVRELVLRPRRPLAPLRRYRGGCADGLACHMLVDRKEHVFVAVTAADYNVGAAAALLEELQSVFLSHQTDRRLRRFAADEGELSCQRALSSPLFVLWETYDSAEAEADMNPRLAIRFAAAAAAAGEPESVRHGGGISTESARTLLALNQSAEDATRALQDAARARSRRRHWIAAGVAAGATAFGAAVALVTLHFVGVLA